MIPFLGLHLLESTVFALVVGFLALCSRKRSAAARHAMWFIASAKFALPAALFSLTGAYVHNLFPSPHALIVISQNLTKFLPAEDFPARAAEAHGGLWILIGMVWLGGAAFFLTIWIRRLLASLKLSTEVLDSEKQSLLRMQHRIGYPGTIRLRSSEAKMEPVLAGIWGPTIVIPQGLSKLLTPAELDTVMLHEIAHAKRWDNLSAAFVHILVCLFWFHPLLWWMERRMNAELELACDELVIRSGAPPEAYVTGILKICKHGYSGAVTGISGFTGSHLRERMERIMSYTFRSPVPHVPRFPMAVLIAAITILPFTIAFFRLSSAQGETRQAAAPSSEQAASRPAQNCVFASKEYPEGSVIQVANGPEQMCARVLSHDLTDPNHPKLVPEWIRTDQATRERSSKVLHLPEPPAPAPVTTLFSCKPKSSISGSNCSCEGADLGFGPGATVDSAKGGLTCEKGNWRSTKPAELGQASNSPR